MCGIHTVLCSGFTVALLCVLTVHNVLDVSNSHMFTNHFPNVHLTQATVTYCFRMHRESAEDGSLRRVQLDTALKVLYTSSEGLSHTVEGDGEEGRTKGDAMDTAEPSAHAQARIRCLCHCHSSLCDSFCTSCSRDFLSPLDFTSLLIPCCVT